VLNAISSNVTLTFSYTNDDGFGGHDSSTVSIDLIKLFPLFTEQIDIVDFNSLISGTYLNGTQYDALGSNDIVSLPDTIHDVSSGFVLGTPFHGGAGDDTITGRDGNDVIFGDAGIDTLKGGPGDDVLQGNFDGDTAIYSHNILVSAVQDYINGIG